MESGVFVPSEIVVDLLIQKIDSLKNRYYVIEGFPKNQENIEIWNRKTSNIFHTKLFFLFEVEQSLAMKRLEARSSSSENPEDNISVIKKRM
jgi:adenylate kinase family enzyme